MMKLVLLGGFDVRSDSGATAVFDSDKDRALLAYLVIEADKPHWRGKLVGLFWPEKSENLARHSLSQTMYIIKSNLGVEGQPAPFALTAQSVQFCPGSGITVDVLQFNWLAQGCPGHRPVPQLDCKACLEHLEQAVNLYQGEFLAGLSLPGCEDFEAWLTLQRENLCQTLLKTLDRLSAGYESGGDLARATAFCRRRLAMDPLDEAGHSNLMGLLARQGLRTEALAQYDACRTCLQDGLGLEPEAQTTRLYQQILAQEQESPIPLKGRHNLPAPLTPMIGREDELAIMDNRLRSPDYRLLSLVGLGGSGKTRAALEVGRGLLESFADGVFLIDLDLAQSSNQALPAGIARALGLGQVAQQGELAREQVHEREGIWEQLYGVLKSRHLLLILDGCETILEQAGEIGRLLQQAPGLKILATSRVSLNLKGETVLALEGLPYFADAHPLQSADPDSLMTYASLRLFVDAARRARPDFDLTPENASAAAAICRLCQGLPLAILMAAAWVDTLSPAQIYQELQRSLDLLTATWRDLPERQRSLRSIFDYSWRLLDADERAIFLRLSVFRGSFSAVFAQQVAGATLIQLRAFLKAAMLMVDGPGSFRLHDLVRQYAQERLFADSSENRAAHDRHAGVFFAVLKEEEPRLKGSDLFAALAEIGQLEADIRAAWDWAIGMAQWDRLLGGVEVLSLFYILRDRQPEARILFETALTAAGGSDGTQAGLLVWACLANQAARFQIRAGAFEPAWQLLHAVLDAGQNQKGFLPLLRMLAITRSYLAMWYSYTGADNLLALDHHQKALAALRLHGNPWDITVSLLWNANCEFDVGNSTKCLSLAQEALSLNSQLGNPYLANWIANNLSRAYGVIGEHTKAIQIWLEQQPYCQSIHTPQSRASYRIILALEFLWAGRLDEARQQSMAVAEIIKSSGLHQFQIADSMTFFCAADLFQGRYEAVRTMAVGEVFQVDNPRRFIYGYMEGLLAILNEQYEFAFNDLTKWCEIFLAQANSMSAAPPWAFLGLVAYRTRQPEAARKYLEDALKASLVSQWDFSYSCCLAVLAQILAEQGDIEGGVTLYAVASHQPLIPASQYFEDLFGLPLARLSQALPEDRLLAARMRGEALSLRETSQAMLEKIQRGEIAFFGQEETIAS
jgi:predicted ATPase/DNA-binding SARP family transcriptional activator